MKLQTINSSCLTWTIHPTDFSDVSEAYCVDGDGLVIVYKRISGVYSVFCEFSPDIPSGIYESLEEALAKGEALLQEYYPEVYEEAMTWDEETQT